MDNVETRVIDIETNEVLKCNQTGMLVVSGPSVFHGYYHYDGPTPFINIAGRDWYKTGDLVSIDDDGFIHFRGRLKRFIKVGGEMISLPALEEPFAKIYPVSEEGPRIAVDGIEIAQSGHIILFAIFELTLHEANQILRDAGFRGVVRLKEVRQIQSIPLLGTGKIDYKRLRELFSNRGINDQTPKDPKGTLLVE